MRSLLAVCTLVILSAPCTAQVVNEKEKAEGFVPLFNSKDLTGWKLMSSKPEGWQVADGVLVNTGKGGGWLGTEKEYANFMLRLDYKVTPAGNSGVYLRAPDTGHISRVGMEIQILDDAHPKYAKLEPWQYCGALYHVVAPKEKVGKPAGEWNTMEIRAAGRQITVIHNGVAIVDANLDECLKDPAIAKEHTGLARTTGRIGLQSHSDRVEFRNLRVKELK
jgi:hypothetical protein